MREFLSQHFLTFYQQAGMLVSRLEGDPNSKENYSNQANRSGNAPSFAE